MITVRSRRRSCMLGRIPPQALPWCVLPPEPGIPDHPSEEKDRSSEDEEIHGQGCHIHGDATDHHRQESHSYIVV